VIAGLRAPHPAEQQTLTGPLLRARRDGCGHDTGDASWHQPHEPAATTGKPATGPHALDLPASPGAVRACSSSSCLPELWAMPTSAPPHPAARTVGGGGGGRAPPAPPPPTLIRGFDGRQDWPMPAALEHPRAPTRSEPWVLGRAALSRPPVEATTRGQKLSPSHAP
jgi:hypothetical protein